MQVGGILNTNKTVNETLSSFQWMRKWKHTGSLKHEMTTTSKKHELNKHTYVKIHRISIKTH